MNQRSQIDRALQKYQQTQEARDPSRKTKRREPPRKQKKPGELTATYITYIGSLMVIWGVTAPAMKLAGFQWKVLAMVDSPVAGFVMAGFGLVAMVIDVLSEGWIAKGIAIAMLICGFISVTFFLPKKKDDGWRPATGAEIALSQLDDQRAEQIVRDRERISGAASSDFNKETRRAAMRLGSRRREVEELENKVDLLIKRIEEAEAGEAETGRQSRRLQMLETEFQCLLARIEVLDAWPYTLDRDLVTVLPLSSQYPPRADGRLRDLDEFKGFHWHPKSLLRGLRIQFEFDRMYLIAPWFDKMSKTGNVVARDGYAVGGLNAAVAGVVNHSPYRKIHAVQIVFMRMRGDRLDPGDVYTSEWLGDPKDHPIFSIASDGPIVSGIATENSHVTSMPKRLGLVFRKPLGEVAGQ
ncbi:MAG: hypothetical protein ACR2NP_12965 [Pirellulaceae bacterium]